VDNLLVSNEFIFELFFFQFTHNAL